MKTEIFTLHEFLKTLKSYEPIFRDKSKATGVIRIKCFSTLSRGDFKKLSEVAAVVPQILELNNKFEWKHDDASGKWSETVFTMKLSDAPTKIFFKKVGQKVAKVN